MKANKWRYLYVIQHSYMGQPWEDVCEYDKARPEDGSPRADLREYRASARPGDGSRYRLIERREKV